MFLAPEIFLGCAPPEILDRHYKLGPITDHRAKFHAGRPTHLRDLALKEKKTSRVKHKSFRKLSFSGGLMNEKRSHTFSIQKFSLCAPCYRNVRDAEMYSGITRDIFN